MSTGLGASAGGYKTFTPLDFDAALDFLGAAFPDREKLKPLVTRLHESIEAAAKQP